jgi:hypothetical protein
VPVAAEVIALHTVFELLRGMHPRARGVKKGVQVHLCRISSAAGLALVRQAKAEGLPVTCDVSVHNLHLTDIDIGYYDSRLRLQPPLRQQRDRDALRAGWPTAPSTPWCPTTTRWTPTPRRCPLPKPSPAPPRWSCCWAWPASGPSRTAWA